MSTLYVDNLQPNLGSRVMAAGHVVQVVSNTLGLLQATNAAYADVGSLSITPTSASSKIFVTFENHIYVQNFATDGWRGCLVRLQRNNVNIYGDILSTKYGEAAYMTSDSERWMTYQSRQHMDEPNSTSEVTYKIQAISRTSSNVQVNNSSYGSQGRITLMEIAQ